MSLNFTPEARKCLSVAQEIARHLGRQNLSGDCIIIAATGFNEGLFAKSQTSPDMLPMSTVVQQGLENSSREITLDHVLSVALGDDLRESEALTATLASLFQRRIRE